MRDDKTLSFHSTSPYKTMRRNRGKHLTCIERPLLDLVSGRLTYHPQPGHPDENKACCMHLPRANAHDRLFWLRFLVPISSMK